MNVMDLIQSFFDSEAAAQLGQSVGLDAQTAQRALGVGVPMQLDALADHAGTAHGQAQIVEAIQNLPDFGSVRDALSGPDGTTNLQRAGELLAPALLGGRAGAITDAVAAQTGAAGSDVIRLMQMALPLLLSLLGNRGGLNAGNIGAMLGGLKGSPADPSDLRPTPERAQSRWAVPAQAWRRVWPEELWRPQRTSRPRPAWRRWVNH